MFLLALAALVAVIVVAVLVRGDEQQVADYLDSVREVAASHQSAASVVSSVMVGLEEMERPMVLAALDDALTEAAAANAALAAESPPGSAAVPGAYATVSSESWLEGLVAFQEAVAALLDDPADPTGRDRLGIAFADFAVGDRAYRSFAASVVTLNGELETRSFPEVRYIPAASVSLYDVALFTQRIAALRELEARFDVAVSDIRFDPQPVGDQDGVPQLPFTETFEIQVTLANRGNEPAVDIAVGIQLLAFADLADAEVVGEETRTIELLEPGQATTLVFDQFVAEPGKLHEVVVRAILFGDEDESSNEARSVFFRNEAQ